MSKVILVLEKPNSCSECPLFNGHYSDMCCGGLNNRSINYPYPDNFRQEWCPLRNVIEKKERDIVKDDYNGGYSHGIVHGWNACIDEILGENK